MKKIIILLLALLPVSLFANNMIQIKGSVGFFQTTHDCFINDSQGGKYFYPASGGFGISLGHETIEYMYEFQKERRLISPVLGAGIGFSPVGITAYGISGVSLDLSGINNFAFKLMFTGELGGGGVPVVGYGFFAAENADFVILNKSQKGLYWGSGLGFDQVIYPTGNNVLPIHFLGEVHTYVGLRF